MLLHHTQCKLNNILKKDLAIFWFRIFLTIATLNHNVTKRMYLAFKFMYRKKKAFEICILNWNCKLWKLIWIWDRIRIKSEFYLLFDYSIASETWKWFTVEPKHFWIRICFFLNLNGQANYWSLFFVYHSGWPYYLAYLQSFLNK